VTNFRTAVMQLERPGDPSVFGEDVRSAAAELVARYPAGQQRSALLPMLHLVQSEQGHVSPDGIAFCADFLGLTKAQVVAVVTFYTMFKRRPTGEYLVSVCTNTLCALMGGDEIYRSLSKTLGVGTDETTPDGMITLEPTRGAPLCSFKEIERQIAGFVDERPESLDAEATGTPTEIGVRLAIERGEGAPSYAVSRDGEPADPPEGKR